MEDKKNTQMPLVDLNTLLHLIPEFDTSQSSQIYRFIRSCDSAFTLAAPSQIQVLLIYALNKITGPGASDVHAKKYVDWIELKVFLIQKYSQTKTIAHLNFELQSLFQKPNESVTEYFHRVDLYRCKIIEKLTAEISDDSLKGRIIMTEETALNVFVNGLKSDIGIMLRTKEPHNLSDAGNFAINEDKIRNMNRARQTLLTNYNRPNYRPIHNPNPQPVSNKTCNYCKKPGHVISECRKRAYNNNIKKNISTQPNNTNFQHNKPIQNSANISHLNSRAAEIMGTSRETAMIPYEAQSETHTLNSDQDLN